MPDQYIAILTLTALVLISPGPDMVLVLFNTALGGKRGGLLTAFGILTSNMVHVGYCAYGVAYLIAESAFWFGVLKYSAAAYLAYLGARSFSARRIALAARQAGGGNGNTERWFLHWFGQGFLNNILNPKGIFFFLSVFSVVITPDTPTSSTIGLVALMQGLCLVFWLVFVAAMDFGPVRLLLEKSQHIVVRLTGMILILLGARVAFWQG